MKKRIINARNFSECVPLATESFTRGVKAVTIAELNEVKVSHELFAGCSPDGIFADPSQQRLLAAAKFVYFSYPNKQLAMITRYLAMVRLRPLPQFAPWYTTEASDSPTFVIRTEVFEVAARLPVRRDGTFDPVAFLSDLMDVTDLSTLPGYPSPPPSPSVSASSEHHPPEVATAT